MKHVWILAIYLIATPAFAQDTEEALRELGMGGVFANADLSLRELTQANDPVHQLRRFFVEAKMPLSPDQLKRLDAIVEAQKTALHNAGNNESVTSRMNVEFMRRINGVLTPDQNNTWRRFRTEQIMMRGGFPALRFTLEEAQTPLTLDQEREMLAVYTEFNRQVTQLQADAKGTPNRAELDKLENSALGKVVRLLTPAQRKALAASRQGSLISKVRP